MGYAESAKDGVGRCVTCYSGLVMGFAFGRHSVLWASALFFTFACGRLTGEPLSDDEDGDAGGDGDTMSSEGTLWNTGGMSLGTGGEIIFIDLPPLGGTSFGGASGGAASGGTANGDGGSTPEDCSDRVAADDVRCDFAFGEGGAGGGSGQRALAQVFSFVSIGELRDTEATVEELRESFQDCYQSGLDEKRNAFEGQVWLKLRVGDYGGVTEISESASDEIPRNVVQCMACAAAEACFSRPRLAPALLNVDINLSATDE